MGKRTTQNSHLDLAAYGHWATGNLVANANRGVFAEWLVGVALEMFDPCDVRTEWDSVDLLYDGLRIEVKTSAYGQVWDLCGIGTTVRFDIARQSTAWYPQGLDDSELAALGAGCEVISRNSGTWVKFDRPRRTADIYVFCLNTSRPATSAKVADPDEWKFWVVPTAVLDNELNGQKTAGERTLDRVISPNSRISWQEIKASVEACRP